MFFYNMPIIFLTTNSTISDSFDGSFAPTSTFDIIGQFIFIIVVFIVVVILAYYSTKWIASAKTSKMAGNLKIIESMSVGRQSVVQLIKVGKKYLLIGVTKDQITSISEIDKNDIEIVENNPQLINASFERHLRSFFNKLNGKESQTDRNEQVSEMDLENNNDVI